MLHQKRRPPTLAGTNLGTQRADREILRQHRRRLSRLLFRDGERRQPEEGTDRRRRPAERCRISGDGSFSGAGAREGDKDQGDTKVRGALVTPRLLLSCFFLLSGAGMLRAQLGFQGAEWMTNGSDAQRSFSIPTDPAISVDRLRTPGFQLLWKTKLSNDPAQVNSLTPAILMDRYIGYRGFRSFAFVAGSSNTIYAIDSDLNRMEWKTKLPIPVPVTGTLTCPGGLTSPIARATTAKYPVPG